MAADEGFYQALKALFEAVVGALRVDASSRDNVPHELVEEAEFLPDGDVRRSRTARSLSLTLRLSDRSQDLKHLPEFVRLRDLIAASTLADELLIGSSGAPVDPNDRDHWLWQFTCFPLLSRYLEDYDDAGFDEVKFNELYAEVVAYSSSPTVRLHGIAPIFNFDMDDEAEGNVALEKYLLIRRLLPSEKSELWTGAADSRLWSRLDLYSLTWTAEITKDVDKLNPIFDPRADLENLESHLRLLHPDPDHPPTINFVSLRPEPRFNPIFLLGGRRSWPVTRAAREFPSVATRRLSTADIDRLQQRWRRRGLLNNRRMVLALRHFSGALDRAQPSEQLLDLWIALETLFLPDGLAGELSFRGSLRLAHYLATGEDRLSVYQDVRTSYDWRSHIIHGGDPEKASDRLKGDIATVVSTTRGYLGRVLETVFDSGQAVNVDRIDRGIKTGQL